jgi:hypothetical protein
MKGTTMRRINFKLISIGVCSSLVAAVLAWAVSGCASTTKARASGSDASSTAASTATTRPAATADAPSGTRAARESGAQLWAENCMRCHNLRSPETYSSAQWEVAVHHMRLRANLTGEEAQKITAFLKSASQ